MTVDEAIKRLEAAKAAGVKSILVAWWEADAFDRVDDEAWEHAAELVERKFDWSGTHNDLAATLDMYTSP